MNGLYDLEDLLGLIGAEIVPHDIDLASLALEAFRRYGKGIDPKARLNLCDCATYALAKAMRAPLLFKGAISPTLTSNCACDSMTAPAIERHRFALALRREGRRLLRRPEQRR